MTDPARPQPGQDPLVDDVADALYSWREQRTSCDWEDHQRAVAVLDRLRERGLLKPKRDVPFLCRCWHTLDDHTHHSDARDNCGRCLCDTWRSAQPRVALTWTAIVVLGLLAWGAVEVWRHL